MAWKLAFQLPQHHCRKEPSVTAFRAISDSEGTEAEGEQDLFMILGISRNILIVLKVRWI